MKIRIALIAAVLALAALPAHAAVPVRIGVAYDIGGVGDQSFNDAAALGLTQAQKQVNIAVDVTVTDGTPANREARIRSLIAKGANPIMAIGSGYAPTILKLSLEFPERQFAIMNDGSVDGVDITSIVFGEVQGAFLAGTTAALATKNGKIAMVALSSQEKMYNDGFLAGANAAKRGAKASVFYSTSALAGAKKALSSGADVIFISIPGSVTDAFKEIAKSKNAGMIMVAPDQFVTVTRSTKKYLLATVEKRVDIAMKEWVLTTARGEQFLDFIDEENGIYGRFYGIENGGVVISLLAPSLAAQSATINQVAALIEKRHA